MLFRTGCRLLVAVVSAAADNINSVAIYVVDKTVGVVDPSAELALQIADQWLRLADAV